MLSELHKAENVLRVLAITPDFDRDEVNGTLLKVAEIIKEARELYESDINPFDVVDAVNTQDRTSNVGIDWSKPNMFDGIGRPDLKPTN